MRCRERLKLMARSSIRAAAAVAIVAAASSACVTTAEKGTSTAAAPEGVILRAGRSIPRGTPDSDYFFSPSMEKVLAGVSRGRDAENGPVCTAPVVHARPIFVFVASDVAFQPGATQPSQGAWATRYEYERCGFRSIHSVLLEARPTEPPAVVRTLAPGETAIPYFLQDKAAEAAFAAVARGGDRNCRPLRITDTTNPIRFSEGPGPGGSMTRSFTEVWFVQVCNRLERALVTIFVPDQSNKANVIANRINEGEAIGRVHYFAPANDGVARAIDLRELAGELACAMGAVREVEQQRAKGMWHRLRDGGMLGTHRKCVAAAICDTIDGKPNIYASLGHVAAGQHNPFSPTGQSSRAWPILCDRVARYVDLVADHEPEFVAHVLRIRDGIVRQLQQGQTQPK